MTAWNTETIADAIPDVVEGPATVHIYPFGGDYDTNTVLVTFGDEDPEDWAADALLVTGFVVNDPHFARTDPDHMDVDVVEFRNRRSDSDGGIQTDDLDLAMEAVRIKHWLKAQGFQVVPTIDAYF